MSSSHRPLSLLKVTATTNSIIFTEVLWQLELFNELYNVVEGELLLQKTQKNDNCALLSSLTLA